MNKPNGKYCELCGTELIDECSQCGAPQCCPSCCDELMQQYYEEQDHMVEVTKEMAIDAGDRTLEGQRIKW